MTWSPRAYAHEITDHHPVDRHAPVCAVSHNRSVRCDERRQPIERLLGAISWKEPMTMFETRIPRNSASRHDAKTIVSTPKTSRIPFGIVSVLARRMLA